MPSVVIGTSVGAINGAAVATEPTLAMVKRIAETWLDIERSDVFAGSLLGRLATLARTGTHLHGNDALRAVLTESLPIALIEDLPVRFECVAASSSARASTGSRPGRWSRPCSPPRPYPGSCRRWRSPASISSTAGSSTRSRSTAPSSWARRGSSSARGRLDRPLEPPRWPWEVALVAFEVARRHRFVGDLASLPEEIELHVLPTGQAEPPGYKDLSALRYRVAAGVRESIDRAHEASLAYLEGL